MMRLAALAFATMLLAGCQTMPASEDDAEFNYAGERGPGTGGETAGDAAPTIDPLQSCPEAAYQVLVGQQISEIHVDSLPEPHRIYGQGDMVTMDYRPDRLNIVTDEDGLVVEVKCG